MSDKHEHEKHEHAHHHSAEANVATATAPSTPWLGAPVTIQQNGTQTLTQSVNGTMFLVAQNTSSTNNTGILSYSSGGARPTKLTLQPLTNQPTPVVNNWGGNNLTVTNQSGAAATPIQVMAAGPGLPGMPTPAALTSSASSIVQYVALQGNSTGGWATVQLYSTSGACVVGITGGPPDATGNNGYVIALNSPNGDTGVPSGQFGSAPGNPAPTGFYATASGNTYNFGSFNWGSATIWVCNLSGTSSASVSVTLVNA